MEKSFWKALLILMLATPIVIAQGARPNFSGYWELDKAKSDFGSLPADDSMTELIDHQDPALNITQTWKNAEGERTRVWQLTTDGAENIHRSDGTEVSSRTHWHENQLVTEWKMKSAANLTQGTNVRVLSDDGTIQTVEVVQQSSQGELRQHLVLVKKKPAPP